MASEKILGGMYLPAVIHKFCFILEFSPTLVAFMLSAKEIELHSLNFLFPSLSRASSGLLC
jgi:hypothetical protein